MVHGPHPVEEVGGQARTGIDGCAGFRESRVGVAYSNDGTCGQRVAYNIERAGQLGAIVMVRSVPQAASTSRAKTLRSGISKWAGF